MDKKSYKMKSFCFYILLVFTSSGLAQTPLTLSDCETLFLKNNLSLLANQYNIDKAEATVLQSKIWDLPQVGFEVNAWAPQNDQKFFNMGKEGEKAAYIQQLIKIGGQRKNQIGLSKSNAEVIRLEFDQLLRDLKYQLRTAFFSIYFDSRSIAEIDKQRDNLKTLIDAYLIQTQKGNVALKDLVRLQNLYLSLKNDRNLLMAEIVNNKKTLITLLNSNDMTLQPAPTDKELEVYQTGTLFPVTELQQMAVTNRPDLLRSQKIIESANWNLKLQRSLSLPSVTLGASYDQRGGAYDNQTNLTLGIPLPLWNQNKGNIKIAKYQLEQDKTDNRQKVLEVQNEVSAAFQKYQELKDSFVSTRSPMAEDLQTVYQGIYTNFKKSNLSILEFTDFMESYNESMITLNQFHKNLINACEELNYATAAKLF
ncbi:TolC family protein [Flavobacterium silvisoli]|uniref:TolC family protein n=2 Tax=Flavobacterium silvisoli TaxID=2529433 RepID=A0A4Q9Z2Z3_9FLAO|nr:TolC family protein [Flavobacterium silvisoli]